MEVWCGVLQGEHVHLLPQRDRQRLHPPRPHGRQEEGDAHIYTCCTLEHKFVHH